jgi:hypothetical protein
MSVSLVIAMIHGAKLASYDVIARFFLGPTHRGNVGDLTNICPTTRKSPSAALRFFTSSGYPEKRPQPALNFGVGADSDRDRS